MKLPKLPEILEISSGSRKGGCNLPGSWDAARIRKDEMDYFMIILPLKLALVIYIGYVLFH
jgi:hypothetical protein